MKDSCSRSGCTNDSTVKYPNDPSISWCTEHDPGVDKSIERWGQGGPVLFNGEQLKAKPKSADSVETQCVWCGRDLDALTVTREHVVPKSKGGRGTINLAPACVACNQEKGDMDAKQYIEHLRWKGRR
jgi:5-methylcytosine-specific restriction endonuclease McrA